jgi:hypothetical protein
MAVSASVQVFAKGKVIRAEGETVVFQPAGTNYELHLRPKSGRYDGPIGQPLSCLVRVQARKVYSVPSGGNFIQPIFGPPRIIQGRVVSLDENSLVVHVGGPIVVSLPNEAHAIDLNRGPIGEGSIVNAVALPGATVEFPTV